MYPGSIAHPVRFTANHTGVIECRCTFQGQAETWPHVVTPVVESAQWWRANRVLDTNLTEFRRNKGGRPVAKRERQRMVEVHQHYQVATIRRDSARDDVSRHGLCCVSGFARDPIRPEIRWRPAAAIAQDHCMNDDVSGVLDRVTRGLGGMEAVDPLPPATGRDLATV